MRVRRAAVHTLLVFTLAAGYTLAGPAGTADAVVTGVVRVSPFTATTSAAKGLTATCPTGTRVIGAGGDTTGANGEVLLDVMRPNAALTSVFLHANEDEDGAAAAWFLQAFIICACCAGRSGAGDRDERLELGRHQERDCDLPRREAAAR